MKHWFNLNHLSEAGGNYILHFYVAVREAMFLFAVGICSVLHAIFPPLFNFKLLEWRVNAILKLHKFLPDHPIWDRVRKQLNDGR